MHTVVALVTFSVLHAPAPPPREFPPDPDEAIAKFEKDTGEVSAGISTEVLRHRQDRLLDHLRETRKACQRKGLRERAEAIRLRIVLLEAAWKGSELDRGATVKGLETALHHGKYRNLLRVMHVPYDQSFFGNFNDFGAFEATDYAGVSGLPSGYWVYVYPCWYLWQDRTGR